MLNRFIYFFLEHRLIAWLLLIIIGIAGLITTPFEWDTQFLPRDPVAVDAIPNIGENQQIVFTQWPGRSPQDIEDQVTYPLTTALLGIPGVKNIRSHSLFGMSSIYLIFDDNIDFYWSRSRILEKLNSLPANTLPQAVTPNLGPDATPLGQLFWYTLEGRDSIGKATGGWDLHELRSVQDFYVRYGLSAAEGVAEVASIGGFVKEYQIDVDPEAMKTYGLTLAQVMAAVKGSNLDVGAQTMEINNVEYFIRGLGYIEKLADIEESVVLARKNVPIRIKDIASVNIGPAARRGILDKSGAEVVGGVVVARYGANPMQVIQSIEEKIAALSDGLPTKILADGTTSKVAIVPFYNRSKLIQETIGTLEEALSLEILITIVVVIVFLLNLASSIILSIILPLAVLLCFVAMRYLGVEANIVALSGIAIAIGTMVDMGIVLTESIFLRIQNAPLDETKLQSIFEGTKEVASAILTAVATTIISFLPIFTMEAAEGKLFQPLAITKTLALLAAIALSLTLIPTLASAFFQKSKPERRRPYFSAGLLLFLGITLMSYQYFTSGLLIILAALIDGTTIYFASQAPKTRKWGIGIKSILIAGLVTYQLSKYWLPLGVSTSIWNNFLFVVSIIAGLLLFFYLLIYYYERILRFLLQLKWLFLLVVGLLLFQGYRVYSTIGEEFMPSLDEGAFLLMPTSMPHAGMQENLKNLRLLDMAVTAIPEIEMVVGKAGRVESPLDPAPMSMYENVIQYKSEYKTDENGRRIRFKINKQHEFVYDPDGNLIPDKEGQYFRQWREHIKSPDDIWNEIVRVTKLPGVTGASKLQPIETRLVMLQTGMRAPMGIKIYGTDLNIIETVGLAMEQALQEVEGVKSATVFAERIVGKPYLLLDIDRKACSLHGLTIATVQQHIQAAVGGMTMTSTVEGRERYGVRIRYPKELRSDPAQLKRIYIPTSTGSQIPLGDLVTIQYQQGPQAIKSEDGFLVGYVLFDREANYSEGEVVDNARQYIDQQLADGSIELPAGISYKFAGNYEQQIRANKRLAIVLPLALGLIFVLLYFQFKSVPLTLFVFSGVFIAFAGGFILLGLYDQPWFMDIHWFDTNLRDLFQIRPINLSIAVWVGFLALFGIATDDGVLVATFLKDSFAKNQPATIPEIRDAVIEGGKRRIRPAVMTTATTLLALLPILTSTGRGADIMLPMAIPAFGGMLLQTITMFTVPVLFALWHEWAVRFKNFKL